MLVRIIEWLEVQWDTYFDNLLGPARGTPDPARSQHPNDLAFAYDRLLIRLEGRREELFRDLESKEGWVSSTADRRQLAHLEEELARVEEDILSVRRSRERTHQDRSSIALIYAEKRGNLRR